MTPSIQSLKRAVALAEQIQNLQAELASVLGSSGSGSKTSNVLVIAPSAPAKPVATNKKKKGKLSAQGLANIQAAQKARWAKVNAVSKPAQPAAKKKKGKMSAAGRAAIVAAQKLRWAKVKAEKARSAKKG